MPDMSHSNCNLSKSIDNSVSSIHESGRRDNNDDPSVSTSREERKDKSISGLAAAIPDDIMMANTNAALVGLVNPL
jgi:hypothetical protein